MFEEMHSHCETGIISMSSLKPHDNIKAITIKIYLLSVCNYKASLKQLKQL